MRERRAQLARQRRALEEWVRTRGYAGWDPYDGLRSRLLPSAWIGKAGRIAWTQFHKWCPLNLRPLLLIPPGRNPKGLGLFLQGHLDLARAGEPGQLERALELARSLEELATPTPHGLGWGYNFDWQSRAFLLPAGTPTVVNTTFIAHALLDLAEAGGEDRWRELARRAGAFVAGDLNRTHGARGQCLSYTRLDHTCIHNANLLGAGLLIRLARLDGDARLAEQARDCCAFSLAAQHGDGSWFYADTSFQSWIDSYHTAFNLMSLRRFAQAGEEALVASALARGESYFVDRLITPAGLVRYRHDRDLPVDVHGPAAAILYLADDPARHELAWTVLDWLTRHLSRSDGSFGFLWDPRLWRRVGIPYMRWSQAWVFAALCRLERRTAGEAR